MWYAIRSRGVSGFRETVRGCLDVAGYAEGRLNELGLHAWRNPHSITVVFDRPPDALLKEWSVAVFKDIAHIITMPHVTRGRIDRFVKEAREALGGGR